MTTTRVVEWKNDEIDGQVEVSIEEKDKSKPIYYTSDEPKFEINVKNSTDFDITNKTCID